MLGGKMEKNFDFGRMEFSRVLAGFSERTPVPGGGAGACLVAALGASLGAMVFRFSVKKGIESHELLELADELEEEGRNLAAMGGEDCLAYEKVSRAFKLPKETDEQKEARKEAIREATIGAMESPLRAMEKIVRLLEILDAHLEEMKSALYSDLSGSAICLEAGMEMAWLNVRINAASLEGEEVSAGALERGSEILEKARSISGRIKDFAGKGI